MTSTQNFGDYIWKTFGDQQALDKALSFVSYKVLPGPRTLREREWAAGPRSHDPGARAER